MLVTHRTNTQQDALLVVLGVLYDAGHTSGGCLGYQDQLVAIACLFIVPLS